MKTKNLNFAIASIALAIVCAFSMFFLSNKIMLMGITALLIVMLITTIVLLNYHTAAIKEQISLLNNKYQADLGGLKARLEKSEELRSKYRVILTQADRVNKDIGDEAPKDIPPILQYHSDFRNNAVLPYLTNLKNVDMPLDPLVKQQIIDSTIELAMQAIDIADAGEWSINNRPEQKLNLDVVAQKINKIEAYAEAIVITDNPAVTPKWIRALSASFKDIVSDSSMIIYSGYKR